MLLPFIPNLIDDDIVLRDFRPGYGRCKHYGFVTLGNKHIRRRRKANKAARRSRAINRRWNG